jgi:hypothetical protein
MKSGFQLPNLHKGFGYLINKLCTIFGNFFYDDQII